MTRVRLIYLKYWYVWFKLILLTACFTNQNAQKVKDQDIMESKSNNSLKKVVKTEDEWQTKLSSKAFHVLRQQGTERAFSGQFDKHFKKGTYVCAGCQLPLFQSETKYNSGCGWPAFYDKLQQEHIVEIKDYSFGMERIEVRCARCDGHLGHVFEDGPRPTGLRYCINSASLEFIPDRKEK